jgi:hypothetical protein
MLYSLFCAYISMYKNINWVKNELIKIGKKLIELVVKTINLFWKWIPKNIEKRKQ